MKENEEAVLMDAQQVRQFLMLNPRKTMMRMGKEDL